MTDDVRIPCHGEQLAAYVYRPDTTQGDAPCVVMASGFSGTRDDGLPGYAEAFRDAGFVVVLFDYRHFGASTGEPRQLINIARQLDDYRAVIGWARDLDGVDPERIVLWGSSFSGGHVLTLAADDARIAAVIAQGPYTDSIATMMCVAPRNIARFVVEALRDQLGAWLGRPPRLVPAIGAPGTSAMITAPGYESTFAAIRPHDSKWRNEFAARVMFTFGFFLPAGPQGQAPEDAAADHRVRPGRHHAGGAGRQGRRAGTARRTAPLPVRSFRHLSGPPSQGRPGGVPSADSAGRVRVIGGA